MRPVATSYFAPCQGHTRHPSLSIRPLARSAKRCRHRLDTAKSCPLEFPTAYWPAPTTLPGVSSDAGPTLISSAISYLPGGTERDATPPPPNHASEHWEPSTARRVPARCPAGSVFGGMTRSGAERQGRGAFDGFPRAEQPRSCPASGRRAYTNHQVARQAPTRAATGNGRLAQAQRVREGGVQV